MHDESEDLHALVCTEVWGGNRKVSRTVTLPSLMAWVASHPFNDGEGGGDLYVRLRLRPDLPRGSGRCERAWSRCECRDPDATPANGPEINLWDQSDFMRGLNDAFNKSKKYATAIVLSFHRITGRLAFSNAGHLPPLWYRAAQRSWGWLEEANNPQLNKVAGLPVGLILGTDYSQKVVTVHFCFHTSKNRAWKSRRLT